MSTEHTREVLDKYLDLEKRSYDRLINGEMKGVKAEDPMLIKTHLKSRIELLEELKEEIIGE